MTHTRNSFAALSARLHADERGFSLVETVIAAGVIFASLLTLAFTATVGFGYQDLNRQRQAATGLANQVMEEVRGLAYASIESGMLSTDLSGDPNIVDCSGVSKLFSCTADASEPGSGETIVSSPGLSTTVPLVPHRSSTAPNTDPVMDGITYQWSTYVTRDTSVTSAPYRVTVLVTWTGGVKGTAPNKLVRIQSLFWSPDGCRSTDTHPFAAPCQPFLYGTAILPQSSVYVSGTVDQTTFASGELLTPEAASSTQQEQIVQAQGSWQGADAVLTDTLGAQSLAGGAVGATNVDSDPATSTPTFDQVACPTDLACAAGSVSSSNSGNSITFTVPETTASTASTTAAAGANVCPPPTATAETDGLACSGARILLGGEMTAVATITNGGLAPGAATLARVAAPGSASTTLVHRNAFPTTDGCSPGSTIDGCTTIGVSRTLGTLNLGGLPSSFTAPVDWAGADAWKGYLVSIVGYTDSTTASGGTDSPVPTASQAGTIYYWNGAGYSSMSVTDAAVATISSSLSLTENIGGHDLTVAMQTAAAGNAPGTTSVTPTSPAGNATRTAATAQSIPPTLVLEYQLSEGAVALIDVTITVNLGTLEATGTYAPAPAQGS
jgi:type II secretory pathway pseudopilin PulG